MEGFDLHFHSFRNENDGVAAVEPSASNAPPERCF
jgi:hypothetical protein